MSKKFNPLSTAVALATAGLMVVVAGCAMNHDGSTVLGESRDSDRNAERLAQTNPSDPTVVANESLRGDQSNPPADASQMAQSGTYIEPAAPTPPPVDTSAAAYPATPPAQTTSTYPSSTDMSASTAATTPAPTPAPAVTTTTTTTTPTTDTSSTSTTSSTTSTEQPLPPRSDRN